MNGVGVSKNKKFAAPQGWVTAVHVNIIGITEVSKHLQISAFKLAKALEETGFQMVADPMDISADSAKVLVVEENKTKTDLAVVKDIDE
jgi:hypothetical protein